MQVMEYRCAACGVKYAAFSVMPSVCIVCRAQDTDKQTRHYEDFSYYIGTINNTYHIVQPIGRHLMRMPAHWELLKHIECNTPDDIIDIEMWPGTIGRGQE